MTARDYEENVFSFGDIFDASRFQPTLDSGKVEVIVLESLWYKKYGGVHIKIQIAKSEVLSKI